MASRIGTSSADLLMGVSYGLLISAAIGGFELFAAAGPLHAWLASLSFTASLLVRSVIYAAVILVITAPHRAPAKAVAAARPESIGPAEDPAF